MKKIKDGILAEMIYQMTFGEIFNKITLGNIIEDDLIFSDRHFLSQQLFMDICNKGINEVPEDLYYICGALV